MVYDGRHRWNEIMPRLDMFVFDFALVNICFTGCVVSWNLFK